MYKKRNVYSSRDFYIKAFIACIPFFVLLVGVLFYEEYLTTIDYRLGEFFYDLRSERLTLIVIFITTIGNIVPQTLFTVTFAIILWLRNYRQYSQLLVFTMLVGSLGLNGAVKELVHRIRPTEINHLIRQGGYSFPSGHAMGATILFGTLIFIIWQIIRRQSVRVLLTVVLTLLIVSIAGSRVYLGVHFVSDIIAGMSLGLSFILTVFGYFRSRDRRYYYRSF